MVADPYSLPALPQGSFLPTQGRLTLLTDLPFLAVLLLNKSQCVYSELTLTGQIYISPTKGCIHKYTNYLFLIFVHHENVTMKMIENYVVSIQRFRIAMGIPVLLLKNKMSRGMTFLTMVNLVAIQGILFCFVGWAKYKYESFI